MEKSGRRFARFSPKLHSTRLWLYGPAVAGVAALAWRGGGLWPINPVPWLLAAAALGGVAALWRVLTPAGRNRAGRIIAAAAALAAAAVLLGIDPALWTSGRGPALMGWLALFGGALAAGGRLHALLDPVDAADARRRDAEKRVAESRCSRSAAVGGDGDSDARVDRLERLALSAGLGLWLLGLSAWTLGVLGWLNQATAAALPAVGFILGRKTFSPGAPARRLWRDFGRAAETWRPLTAAMALAVVVASLALAAAATLPPTAYDVIEYHAQLPREHLERGRTGFLPHNAFSGFPQQMESLSLAAFALAGGAGDAMDAARSPGVWMAQLLHWSFLPLLMVSLGLSARRLARRLGLDPADGDGAAYWWPAAAALAAPGTIWMATWQQLYVETGLSALASLALLSALRIGAASPAAGKADGLADFGARPWRGHAATGLLLGAAAGCKYTVLPFLAAPLCLYIAFGGAGESTWRRRLGGAAAAGLVCWLAFAPWMAGNWAATGNPFYPLANQRFGVADWDDARERRMTLSHASSDFGFDRFLADAGRVIFGETVRAAGPDGRPLEFTRVELGVAGWLLLPGLLPALALGWRRPGAAAGVGGVAAWLLAFLGLWFFLTHRMDRFFHAGQMLACLLSGVGWAGLLSTRSRKTDAPPIPDAPTRGTPNPADAPHSDPAGMARRWGGGALAALALASAYGQMLDFAALDIRPGRAPVVWRVLAAAAPAEDWLRAAYAPSPLRVWLAAPENAGAKVMMAGAADPFWLRSGGYGYAVVFSGHPVFGRLAAGMPAEAVRDALQTAGYTHLYVNWSELGRLNDSPTYGAPYALSPEAEREWTRLLTEYARPEPGWPDAGDLRALAASGRSPWLSRLPGDYPSLFAPRFANRAARHPHELYRLKTGG